MSFCLLQDILRTYTLASKITIDILTSKTVALRHSTLLTRIHTCDDRDRDFCNLHVFHLRDEPRSGSIVAISCYKPRRSIVFLVHRPRKLQSIQISLCTQRCKTFEVTIDARFDELSAKLALFSARDGNSALFITTCSSSSFISFTITVQWHYFLWKNDACIF